MSMKLMPVLSARSYEMKRLTAAIVIIACVSSVCVRAGDTVKEEMKREVVLRALVAELEALLGSTSAESPFPSKVRP